MSGTSFLLRLTPNSTSPGLPYSTCQCLTALLIHDARATSHKNSQLKRGKGLSGCGSWIPLPEYSGANVSLVAQPRRNTFVALCGTRSAPLYVVQTRDKRMEKVVPQTTVRESPALGTSANILECHSGKSFIDGLCTACGHRMAHRK